MLFQPACPFRPPGPLFLRSLNQETIGIKVVIFRPMFPHAEASTSSVTEFGNDSDIVAASRKQICHLGFGLQVDFVCRAPWGDMIAFGTDREDRDADIGERDRLVAGHKSAFRKIVIKKELAQIIRVHLVGHAGCIGVPGMRSVIT
jgi:hypothetical protein